MVNQTKESFLLKLIKAPSHKLTRLFDSTFNGIEPNRQDNGCSPEKCSTPDGKTGAACCYLDGIRCPLLSEDYKCRIYFLRPFPINCHRWPHKPKELEKVQGCSYSWPNQGQA